MLGLSLRHIRDGRRQIEPCALGGLQPQRLATLTAVRSDNLQTVPFARPLSCELSDFVSELHDLAIVASEDVVE